MAVSILAAAFGLTAMRNRARRSIFERRVTAPQNTPVPTESAVSARSVRSARSEAAQLAPHAVAQAASSHRRTLSLLAAAASLLLVAGVITVVQAPTGASAGDVREASTFTPLPAPQAQPETAEPTPPTPVDPPVRIDAAQIGVAAAVDPLGLNPDGTVQVPADYARTGWFTGLEAPGQVGTSVIVGHYDSKSGPAVFYRLRELGPGGEFAVTLASGVVKTFIVDRVATYPKNQFPVIEVYGPSSASSLRLVTCGGSFDKRRRSYRDNVVVYATEKVTP